MTKHMQKIKNVWKLKGVQECDEYNDGNQIKIQKVGMVGRQKRSWEGCRRRRYYQGNTEDDIEEVEVAIMKMKKKMEYRRRWGRG